MNDVQTGKATVFHISAEVDRLFDASSVPADGQSVAVILMGGPATGKTVIRKRKYSIGYVLIDAADIFLSLSRGGYFSFPVDLQEPMDMIGRLVAHRAVSEHRNIVTEIIGADYEATMQLIEALKGARYVVDVEAIMCDIEEAMRRNMSRGDDDISAYYAEPFQIAWIVDACNENSNAKIRNSA